MRLNAMNKLIDEKGKLFGRVSVIDAAVVCIVLLLAAGYVYKQTSRVIQPIINAGTPFYVTFRVEGVRSPNLGAIEVGDIFYKQYERHPLGEVVRFEYEQAYALLVKTDGTAVSAPVEGRYDMYITLLCTGSITDTGYYANGTQQLTVGGRVNIQSNMILNAAYVHEITVEI